LRAQQIPAAACNEDFSERSALDVVAGGAMTSNDARDQAFSIFSQYLGQFGAAFPPDQGPL
jgi:hypothetical protein